MQPDAPLAWAALLRRVASLSQACWGERSTLEAAWVMVAKAPEQSSTKTFPFALPGAPKQIAWVFHGVRVATRRRGTMVTPEPKESLGIPGWPGVGRVKAIAPDGCRFLVM